MRTPWTLSTIEAMLFIGLVLSLAARVPWPQPSADSLARPVSMMATRSAWTVTDRAG
jgi:hypothetical protein